MVDEDIVVVVDCIVEVDVVVVVGGLPQYLRCVLRQLNMSICELP